MKKTQIAVWNAVIKETEKMMAVDETLVMFTDAENLFYKNFNYYYNLIVINFMKSGDKNLDRHKVAAVIICAILESNILGIARGEEGRQTIDDIFLANEKIAVNIAFSYMYQELLQEYDNGKIPYDKLFDSFVFPKPLSCDREYTEIICRDLFFAKTYFQLNPLSIANFLFLLEAYSFEVLGLEADDEKWEIMRKMRKKEQCEMELKKIRKVLENIDVQMRNEKKELETKKKKLEKELLCYQVSDIT